MRASGAVSGGDYARRGRFLVGGYDFVNNSPLDTLILGAYDGSFVLRGYEPGCTRAAPTADVDRVSRAHRAGELGPVDDADLLAAHRRLRIRRWGGAFSEFQFDKLRLFYKDERSIRPTLHTSIGWKCGPPSPSHSRGYELPPRLRHGFDKGATENGQLYVLSTSGSRHRYAEKRITSSHTLKPTMSAGGGGAGGAEDVGARALGMPMAGRCARRTGCHPDVQRRR